MQFRFFTLVLLCTIASSTLIAQNENPPVPQGGNKNDVPPKPEHTGWATLVKDTGRDFAAFPRRKSTWTLLGIGGAASLGTHPADQYVERHIVGNKTAADVFKPGRWIGSSEVQVGTAVGLWVIGRYVVAPAADEPRTNKISHLGFDLIRAQLLTEGLVQG